MNTLTQVLIELDNKKEQKVTFHFERKCEHELQSPVLTLDQRPNFNNLLHEDMSVSELVYVFGRKWKVALHNLGVFVRAYQFIVDTRYYVPYPISVNSKRLCNIFRNKIAVSRVVDMAESVGLLFCCFNNYSSNKHLAKEYYYNKDMERVIKQLLKKYNIKCSKEIVNFNDESSSKSISLDANKYSVKFSSKLRIKDMTDEEALKLIGEKYEDFYKYQKLFDEMNNTYLKDRPEQQIKFVPSITRSKLGYITKIGIRATSAICNLKVHLNGNTNYKGVLRDSYLDSIYGKGNWFENDVKSSVPRVAYLMKTGEWLDQSIDVYELIFKKFENAQERRVYKNFFMKLYFDREEQLFNHNKQWITDSIAKFGKGNCEKMLKDAKKKVVALLGDSLDSEIFYHESCIYGLFVSFLRNQGIEVVQIYDAFFSNVDTSVYNWKLKEIAEEYYKEYVESNKDKEEEREEEEEVRDNKSMYIGYHIRFTSNKVEYKLVKRNKLGLEYKEKQKQRLIKMGKTNNFGTNRLVVAQMNRDDALWLEGHVLKEYDFQIGPFDTIYLLSKNHYIICDGEEEQEITLDKKNNSRLRKYYD